MDVARAVREHLAHGDADDELRAGPGGEQRVVVRDARLADRLEAVKVHDHVTPDDRAFIERLDMFFLATADADGRPSCSYKGGDPGFVSVLDERTLAFPSYDGNGMFLSAGNMAVNPHVGLRQMVDLLADD